MLANTVFSLADASAVQVIAFVGFAIAALGANVGAGMLLREGTRAVLKFFPGWGNVVCGMVAGAGTYAIGRAAIVYFLEGLSLRDARRAYITNRKKPVQPGRLEQARRTTARTK